MGDPTSGTVEQHNSTGVHVVQYSTNFIHFTDAHVFRPRLVPNMVFVVGIQAEATRFLIHPVIVLGVVEIPWWWR